jgi:hypothetical protein
MPESVTDRPTKSHEYVFLLSKNERYYYDNEAIREQNTENTKQRLSSGPVQAISKHRKIIQVNGDRKNKNFDYEFANGRNKRTVWTIPTKPYSEAHFATFPEELIEPMVLAGTSEKGYCPECGQAWRRRVQKSSLNRKDHEMENDGPRDAGIWSGRCGESSSETIGWLPSCNHDRGPIPGIILDPFFGAGTTGLVSRKLLRNYIGIELNQEYIDLAKKRLNKIPQRLDRWATFEDKDAKMGCR